MEQEFKIYVDQLKEGHTEEIAEKLDPKMMDVHEDDLKFTDIIDIDGQAYLAGSDLVVCLNVHTEATMLCVICNDEVKIPVELDNFYHSTPLDEIKSGIFDFKEMLREDILLATPLFAECHNGQCPERERLKMFLTENNKNSDDEGYHPFADL